MPGSSQPWPRLFVFDLDGTLVDSRRDIAESANAVLEACGHTPHSEEAIGGMVGDGAAMLIARAFTAAGADTPPDALERFLNAYNPRLLRHTREYAGVTDLLSALAARATLAVLTNKPIEATRAILDGLHLSRFFGALVLGGDGPHPRKPDPAGLLRIMEMAGAHPADTMMVGDSAIDFLTSRNAGTRACLARYGFGLHGVDQAEVRATDLLIEHPIELLSRL